MGGVMSCDWRCDVTGGVMGDITGVVMSQMVRWLMSQVLWCDIMVAVMSWVTSRPVGSGRAVAEHSLGFS